MSSVSMREKYQSLALTDLKEIAKSRGIRGTSSMKKADVIEAMVALDEKENQNTEAAEPVRRPSGTKSVTRKKAESAQARQTDSVESRRTESAEGRRAEGVQGGRTENAEGRKPESAESRKTEEKTPERENTPERRRMV